MAAPCLPPEMVPETARLRTGCGVFDCTGTALDSREKFAPGTASEAKVLLKDKASYHELGKYVLFKNKQVGHFTK